MIKKTTVVLAGVVAFAAGFGAFAASSVFTDVPADHWAVKSIEWANDMGIMKGPGDMPGKFDPAGAVNRAQLATVSERVYDSLDARITALEGKIGNDDVVVPSVAPSDDAAKNVPAVDKSKDHIRGNQDAQITIIEYSDFECPFCQRVHPTLKQVVDSYGGKVNWVYRHFPLSFHEPAATQKAIAAECAAEIGGNDKFWEYADYLYEKQVDGSTKSLMDAANAIGIAQYKFEDCLGSGKYDDKIAADMAGGAAAGVNGTPGNIVIDNTTGEAISVTGAQPIENFKSAIDALLIQ